MRHQVVINGAWLSALQALNMAIPLLTLPYVTRVLGATHYGFFAVALNLITYLQVVVEYGFNLTGSRKIALAENHADLQRVFSNIVAARLLLAGLSMLLLLAGIVVLRVPRSLSLCMLILSAIVIGEAMRQTWVFQGLQQMSNVTAVVATARLVSTALVFLFVKSSGQLYLYCALYAASYVLAGALSALLVRVRFGIKFVTVSWASVLGELLDGWPLFTTSAMSLVFSGVGVTALGVLAGSTEAGMYAAIQKIPTILVVLYTPVGQALYPFVSSKYQRSFESGVRVVVRVARYVLPVAGVVGILLALGHDWIVSLALGPEFAAQSILMVPLAAWLFFSLLNNLLGVQVLVASGHSKEYSSAFRVATLVIVGLCALLGYQWGSQGIAAATLLAEGCLTALLLRRVIGLQNRGKAHALK